MAIHVMLDVYHKMQLILKVKYQKKNAEDRNFRYKHV